jgi:cytochrome c553
MTPKLVGLKYEYLIRQLQAYQHGTRAGGLSAMKHIMAPLFQSPRMMQAIGVYAEEVSIVPVLDSASGAQQ